jgi:phosphatidylserine/phosphatidylglycerophosphate/cardiolipin synthase-like enzyme
MSRLLLFSIGSVALAIVAACWIAGTRGGAAGHGGAKSGAKSQLNQAKQTGSAVPPAAEEDGIAVYFSPNGGCADAIVHAIDGAHECVYVQAAQFTSAPIARALVAAKARGVDVRVVVDRKKEDDDHSQIDRLLAAGIATFADGQHHTAHNKLMLIDHHLILTGSFNFTRDADTENAENLLVIDGKPQLLAAYERNFKEHLGHSKPFEK